VKHHVRFQNRSVCGHRGGHVIKPGIETKRNKNETGDRGSGLIARVEPEP